MAYLHKTCIVYVKCCYKFDELPYKYFLVSGLPWSVSFSRYLCLLLMQVTINFQHADGRRSKRASQRLELEMPPWETYKPLVNLMNERLLERKELFKGIVSCHGPLVDQGRRLNIRFTGVNFVKWPQGRQNLESHGYRLNCA